MRHIRADLPLSVRAIRIAHDTKFKNELGAASKDGWFDDIKVWIAKLAKPAKP
jgi:hypothetical protein